ncbi:MAG: AraC family transcriptional regulator [Clostridiales bacterium]|nr:AraC family transcriptional regulator [Clostridiales bacterium]
MEHTFFEKYKTSEVTSTRRVINTPSLFIRKNFLYIQEAGCLKSLKPHLSRRSGLNSYLFLIVLSGSGTVSYQKPNTSDICYVDAAQGDCFFLDCLGAYTHISSENDPWELLWIHFTGPQAKAYYTCFQEQRNWHFRSLRLTELTAAVETILALHETKSDDTDLLSAYQLVNILTILCTEHSGKENLDSALSDKLHRVLSYLDDHYTENISLDWLSEQFFISKYYLSREFKKQFGTTIIQYLLTKKITNAKELLRYSGASIEDIARLCGIDDASYFNKVFKKMEGCTASEYRKRW